MSRVGKKPIELPDKVEAKLEAQELKIKGPKGELKLKIHPWVKIEIKDKEVLVAVKNAEMKVQNSLWGTFRSLIQNMIIGVEEGYEKKLEVNGVGYRVSLSGKKLVLNLGYSHPIEFSLPEGLEAKVEKNIITVSGADKQMVGETAAQIRKLRKPEPYKGKGIKYIDEVIRRKAGKAAKAAGAAGE